MHKPLPVTGSIFLACGRQKDVNQRKERRGASGHRPVAHDGLVRYEDVRVERTADAAGAPGRSDDPVPRAIPPGANVYHFDVLQTHAGRSVRGRRSAENDHLVPATPETQRMFSQHALRAAEDLQGRNVGKEDDSH